MQGRVVGKTSVPEKSSNEGSDEKHEHYGLRGFCLAVDGSFRVLRLW